MMKTLTLASLLAVTTVVVAQNVVENPTATQTITQPSSTSLNVAGTFNVNGIVTVSPGSSVQTAINALTSGGIIYLAPGTYPCITSLPSNVAIVGLFAPSVSANYTSNLLNTTNVTETQVEFTNCATITIPAGAQNIRLENLTFDFANSGDGLHFVSGSLIQLRDIAIVRAGDTTAGAAGAVLSFTCSGASGQYNSVRNTLDHVELVGVTESGSTAYASAGLFLGEATGSGNDCAVTLNHITDLGIAGNVKYGIEVEANTDTNYFYGVHMEPISTVSGSGAVAFNTLSPSSDVDADANLFVGIEHTGGFTYSFVAGQTSGNVFWDTDLDIIHNVAADWDVLGGTPSFSGLTEGLGAPGYNAALFSGEIVQPGMSYSTLPTTYAKLGMSQFCTNCVPASSACSASSPASCICTTGTGEMFARYENFMGNGANWYCH